MGMGEAEGVSRFALLAGIAKAGANGGWGKPRTVPGQGPTGVNKPKAQQLRIDDLWRPARQASQLAATVQLNVDNIEPLQHITDRTIT
jgi:hypothetical protein